MLEAVLARGDGLVLTFRRNGATQDVHGEAILALPFTLLRKSQRRPMPRAQAQRHDRLPTAPTRKLMIVRTGASGAQRPNVLDERLAYRRRGTPRGTAGGAGRADQLHRRRTRPRACQARRACRPMRQRRTWIACSGPGPPRAPTEGSALPLAEHPGARQLCCSPGDWSTLRVRSAVRRSPVFRGRALRTGDAGLHGAGASPGAGGRGGSKARGLRAGAVVSRIHNTDRRLGLRFLYVRYRFAVQRANPITIPSRPSASDVGEGQARNRFVGSGLLLPSHHARDDGPPDTHVAASSTDCVRSHPTMDPCIRSTLAALALASDFAIETLLRQPELWNRSARDDARGSR